MQKMNKNNPLTPFFKGELDDDLIYSPLTKGDQGGCFKYAYLLVLCPALSKNLPLKTLKKGVRGLSKTLNYYVKMAFFNDYITKS
jgi:hypothetical protein